MVSIKKDSGEKRNGKAFCRFGFDDGFEVIDGVLWQAYMERVYILRT